MTQGLEAPARRPLLTLEDVVYVLHRAVPFRVLCSAARVQGRLHHLTRAQERATVRQNLHSAFGAELDRKAVDRLARQAFEYRQLRGLLVTLAPVMTSRQAARLFPIDGLEHLERARAGQGGAVVVTSHLNSICAFIAIERLRGFGYDIRLSLASKEEPYPLSAFRRRLYRLTGGETFAERTAAFYAQFNVRPIIRALQAGAGVVIVGDGWHSAGFVDAEFLGRRVQFTTGAMSVGRLSGVPVVPMFTVGSPPDRLRFVFEEPIEADAAADPRADVQRMVREYARRLERHVRQNPACWQHWFERDALATMEHWSQRSLEERYRMGG